MKKYTITVNGTAYEVEVEEMGGVLLLLKLLLLKQLLLLHRHLQLKALLLLHRLLLQNLLLLAQLLSVLLCLVKFSK